MEEMTMTRATSLFEGMAEGFRGVAFLLLGWINFALLAFVYFAVIAATAIAAKASNRHFLKMSVGRGEKTHWSKAEPSGSGGVGECLKQF